MDKKSFNLNMELYASAGVFLTLEEQQIMRTSLPLLKMANRFESLTFWGKIFGEDSDYYIVYGCSSDVIRNRMYFYSLDGYLWRMLFKPKLEDIAEFFLVRTRFSGDPTKYHIYYDLEAEDESDVKKMMEQDRLSTLVKLIDVEASIAPKEALYLDHNGMAKINDSFSGLSIFNATKLNSYVHLRLPETDVAMTPRYEFRSLESDRAVNFLEPIDGDIPKGCWVLNMDEACELVTLRNLWWPGFIFYHKPTTSEYGSIYIGYGERNDDLPFML